MIWKLILTSSTLIILKSLAHEKEGKRRNLNPIMYNTHQVEYMELLNIGIYTATGQEK